MNPVNHSSIQKELCSATYPTYQPWEFGDLIILLKFSVITGFKGSVKMLTGHWALQTYSESQ